MKLYIEHSLVEITPSEVKNLKPTFTLLHGRRFQCQTSDGKGKEVALNSLISAIKKATIDADRPEKDVKEISEFCKEFSALNDKGYEAADAQINNANFLTRIVTKIKHFFSKKQRDYLLKEFDQSIKMEEKRAPLRQYIENEDVKGAENFLKDISNTKELLNGKKLNDGSRLVFAHFLLQAIKKNNFEMVDLLLKYKADPNAQGGLLQLPIVYAVKEGNPQIVKLLLEKGANISKCPNKILVSAHANKKGYENYLDIMQCLVQQNVNLNPNDALWSPLINVAEGWDKNPDKAKATLEMMIAKGAHFSPMDRARGLDKIPQACVDFLKSRGVNF